MESMASRSESNGDAGFLADLNPMRDAWHPALPHGLPEIRFIRRARALERRMCVAALCGDRMERAGTLSTRRRGGCGIPRRSQDA